MTQSRKQSTKSQTFSVVTCASTPFGCFCAVCPPGLICFGHGCCPGVTVLSCLPFLFLFPGCLDTLGRFHCMIQMFLSPGAFHGILVPGHVLLCNSTKKVESPESWPEKCIWLSLNFHLLKSFLHGVVAPGRTGNPPLNHEPTRL